MPFLWVTLMLVPVTPTDRSIADIPPTLLTESSQTSTSAWDDVLFYSVFQGPHPSWIPFFFYFLSHLKSVSWLLTTGWSGPSPTWEINGALIPPPSGLERNGVEKSFRNIWGVLNVDFVSCLTCFYKRKKVEKIALSILGRRNVILEGRGMEGKCHLPLYHHLGPTPLRPLAGPFSFSFLSRISPNSLGPVPKFSRLWNGDT